MSNKKKKQVEIFISYALDDSKRLQIPKIAENIKIKSPQITVHYWEGWDGYPNGNMIDFMETYITKSDIFIPICTKAMLDSKSCKKERDLAYYQNIDILPVYEKVEFIPVIFRPYRGISIVNKTVELIVEEIITQVSSFSKKIPPNHLEEISEKTKVYLLTLKHRQTWIDWIQKLYERNPELFELKGEINIPPTRIPSQLDVKKVIFQRPIPSEIQAPFRKAIKIVGVKKTFGIPLETAEGRAIVQIYCGGPGPILKPPPRGKKYCPKCGVIIPMNWNTHHDCGWQE